MSEPSYVATLDAVDDLGASPDGSAPLRLDDDRIGPDTDVVFPDGEFDVVGVTTVERGALRFRAAESASPVLTPPSGANYPIVDAACDRFVFDGIDVDVSDGVTGLRVEADSFEIANVTVRGRGTHPDRDVTNCLSLAVTDPEGTGIVRNVVAAEGSTWARYKRGDGRVWAWVGPDHVGDLRVRDCRVEEFGNNGIYGSAAPGRIVVEGCEFWNNNVASLRFGADGCAVRDTVVGIDADRYTGPREPDYESDTFFLRAVWIEAKVGALASPGRVTIADSTVVVRDAPAGRRAVLVRPNAGALTVSEGTIIDVDGDTDAPPIEASRPGPIGPAHDVIHPQPEPPYDIDLDTVRLSGGGRADAAVRATGRDVTARRVVAAFADGRDGFRVVDGDCTLVDCHVGVGGRPAVVLRSDGTDRTEAIGPGVDGPRLIRRNLSTRADAAAWRGMFVRRPAVSDADPSRITVAGAPGPGESLRYELVAAAGSALFADATATEAIGGTASGTVPSDGRETHYLRGALAAASFSGGGSVTLDGDPVRLARLAAETRRRASGSDGADERPDDRP